MIQFEIEVAKNKENTLKINDYYIYSKYSPIKDAYSTIEREINYEAEGYILVGLGLGYHLERLLSLTTKEIVLILLDKKEISLFEEFNKENRMILQRVTLFNSTIKDSILNYQIIIPPSFIRAIGQKHPLHDFLQDISIRQRSYKRFAPILESNFNLNLRLHDQSINSLKNKYLGKKVCLISSGPSLDNMFEVLREVQQEVFILSVGSALKALLKNGVIPDGVIISDGQDNIQKQLKDSNYDGILFYLSTANHETVKIHDSERFIILQYGYDKAESLASQNNIDLLDTGGSVATVGFSLVEYMGFQTMFLFGQDLGFKENKTHSNYSTSGRTISDKNNLRKIVANSGNEIYTTQNLYTYLRWFNLKMEQTNLNVYNMALDGAKINKVPYIGIQQFELLVKNENL